MILTAIVAMTPEHIIGKGGELPWNLPDDLKFFKGHTSGHPIVMGRKTFDSIGRPLPKRQNIVLTRDPKWSHNGVEMIQNPEDLAKLKLIDQRVFVIGGEQIYRFFLPILDEIIITHVADSYEGDTYFPQYSHLFPNSDIILEHENFVIRRHFK